MLEFLEDLVSLFLNKVSYFIYSFAFWALVWTSITVLYALFQYWIEFYKSAENFNEQVWLISFWISFIIAVIYFINKEINE